MERVDYGKEGGNREGGGVELEGDIFHQGLHFPGNLAKQTHQVQPQCLLTESWEVQYQPWAIVWLLRSYYTTS